MGIAVDNSNTELDLQYGIQLVISSEVLSKVVNILVQTKRWRVMSYTAKEGRMKIGV